MLQRTKVPAARAKNFFEKTLDFWLRLWYNKDTERGVVNER